MRKTIKAGVAFDQELGTIHKFDCTIVNEGGNTEVKPFFCCLIQKLVMEITCTHLTEELLNNLL